ncbi:hypothetical protein AB0F17_09810 [Nonomuraea sp. NPDC026600]|uniref:SecDF P1 head subdomain-containing protein n=1 Tax=Nonomuraea sp. NPDC026600 TaxID=3155363 RepID=UPI0033FD0396
MKRVHVIAIVVATFIVLGLAGLVIVMTGRVLTAMTGAPRPESPPASFELRPVLEESSVPCAPGTVAALGGSSCYKLGQGMADIRAEKATAAMSYGTTWTVQVTLNETDGPTFSDLTSRLYQLPAPRNKLAVVVDGKVITAPTITQQIPGRVLEISGALTQQTATDLARRLVAAPN